MPVQRLLSALLIVVLILVGCDSLDRQTDYTADDGEMLLETSIDHMRNLETFNMDVTQGGTPYRFYFQLGPSALQFVTVMTKTEGAFVAPNNLYASARILVRGVSVNVGLFANSIGQWIKPLATGEWVEYQYAPGFDPAAMMQENEGFHSAIRRMTEIEYVGVAERNGREMLHVTGIADGETINQMLFGLLYILEDRAIVDVYIDPESLVPHEVVLTLPDTATDETEDTFWRIELYNINDNVAVDTPSGVVVETPEAVEADQPSTPTNYWLWGSLLSALVGAIASPVIFYAKCYRRALGFVSGALVGAVSSLIGLTLLWVFLPVRERRKSRDVTSDHAPPAYKRMTNVNPWLVMAFIAIPVFVGSLDLTVVSAFMPQLLLDLGLPVDTGLDDASWVVTVYLLAYTVSLTFMGRLSDLIGRRRVYLACLVTFIIGSVWIAVAHTFPTDWLSAFYRTLGMRVDTSYVNLQVIILGRIVEAIGAGALVPVSLALVGDLFPPEKRARPLGLVAAMDTLGWVLGPVYGGVFLQIMSWQGLFWMNVPLTLISLVSVLYALRRVPMVKVQGRFDFVGTTLITGALTALVLGLGANVDLSGANVSLDTISPLPPYAVPMLLAGLLFFVSFLFVEAYSTDPLISLQMFKRRNLSAASLVNLLVGYCLFIGLVSVPLLVNLRLESGDQVTQAALETGLLLSTLTLPMAAAAVIGGWVSDRIGIRNTIITGLLFALVGYLAIWQTWTIDIQNTVLGVQMAIVGVGIGLTFSPVSTAVINSAYDPERGVASALVIILRLIGMTVSISTLSSIMYYRAITLAGTEASASGTIGIEEIINSLDAVVRVLGEMGLIGAVLSGIALIPALFIANTVVSPEEATATTSDAPQTSG